MAGSRGPWRFTLGDDGCGDGIASPLAEPEERRQRKHEREPLAIRHHPEAAEVHDEDQLAESGEGEAWQPAEAVRHAPQEDRAEGAGATLDRHHKAAAMHKQRDQSD